MSKDKIIDDSLEHGVVETEELVVNKNAKRGLYFGIASIFFFWIGILPLIGLYFSISGLIKAKQLEWKGVVPAAIGLLLNGLYVFVYLHYYGHINI